MISKMLLFVQFLGGEISVLPHQKCISSSAMPKMLSNIYWVIRYFMVHTRKQIQKIQQATKPKIVQLKKVLLIHTYRRVGSK